MSVTPQLGNQQQQQLRIIHQDSLAAAAAAHENTSVIQTSMNSINSQHSHHHHHHHHSLTNHLQHGQMFHLPPSHHFDAAHQLTNQQHHQCFQAQARVVQILDSNQPLLAHFNQHTSSLIDNRPNDAEACFAATSSQYSTAAALQNQQQPQLLQLQQHSAPDNSAADLTQPFIYNHQGISLANNNQQIDNNNFIPNQSSSSSVQCSTNQIHANRASESSKSSANLSSESIARDHQPADDTTNSTPNRPFKSNVSVNLSNSNNNNNGPIGTCNGGNTNSSSDANNNRQNNHIKHNRSKGQKNKIDRTTCLRGSTSPRRTFLCPTCSKSFTEKFNMKRHMQVHSQTRPKFLCNECTKSFAWKDNFIRHKRAAHSSVSSGLRHIPA